MTLALAELADVSTFGPRGPGLTGQRIYGARVAVERVARAWLSPRGALTWARDRGVSILELQNSTHDKTSLGNWRAALVAEAEAVEFVDRCDVTITLADRVITLVGELLLVDGRTYRLAVTLKDGAALVTIGAT
ncbi:MAG: hypothetical protein ABJE95_19595 [Byssovorax sp.]